MNCSFLCSFFILLVFKLFYVFCSGNFFFFNKWNLCIPKEKEMATHSSVLAWKVPGTGEPGGLPSMGSHRVGTLLKWLSSSSSKPHIKSRESQLLWLKQRWWFWKLVVICSLVSSPRSPEGTSLDPGALGSTVCEPHPWRLGFPDLASSSLPLLTCTGWSHPSRSKHHLLFFLQMWWVQRTVRNIPIILSSNWDMRHRRQGRKSQLHY